MKDEITYLFTRLNGITVDFWEMRGYFSALYGANDNLFMLELKLIRVSKKAPDDTSQNDH